MSKLKNWDYKDFMGIVDYLTDNWVWPSLIKKNWGENRLGKDILFLEVHTGGHSENEKLINELLANRIFCMMWYAKWERGGHYTFEINPFNVGYLTVANYCKEKKCTRQNIHKQKEKFHWIIATPNLRFIKPIK